MSTSSTETKVSKSKKPGWKQKLKNFLFHAPTGALVSLIMFHFVFSRLLKVFNIKPKIQLCIRFVIVGALTVGYATLPFVRCVCLVTMPTLFGKQGVVLAKTSLVGAISEGPLMSIMYNIEELERAFICNARLTRNATAAKMELTSEPLQKIAVNLAMSSSHFSRMSFQIKDIQRPVLLELDRLRRSSANMLELRRQKLAQRTASSATESSEEQKGTKEPRKSWSEQLNLTASSALADNMQLQCEDIFTEAYDNCIEQGDYLSKECWKNYSFWDMSTWALTMICPKKNVVKFCDQLDVTDKLGKLCTPPKYLSTSLISSDSDVRDFMKSSINISTSLTTKIYYKIKKPKFPKINLGTWKDVKARFNFNIKVHARGILKIIAVICDIIRCLVALYAIFKAYSYTKKYLKEIGFDNTYMTGMFYEIEMARRSQNRMALLPLYKFETDYFNIFSRKMPEGEKKKIGIGILTTVIFLFFASVMIYINSMIISTMKVMKTYEFWDYRLKGSYDVIVHLVGNGTLRKMFENVLTAFNTSHVVDTYISNEECHLTINGFDESFFVECFYFFAWLITAVILQAYSMRLRTFMTWLIFPKRYKQRVLWLYNYMLRSRVAFIERSKEELAKQTEPVIYQNVVFGKIDKIKFTKKLISIRNHIKLKCCFCNMPFKRSKLRTCQQCKFKFCVMCHRPNNCWKCELYYAGIDVNYDPNNIDSYPTVPVGLSTPIEKNSVINVHETESSILIEDPGLTDRKRRKSNLQLQFVSEPLDIDSGEQSLLDGTENKLMEKIQANVSSLASISEDEDNNSEQIIDYNDNDLNLEQGSYNDYYDNEAQSEESIDKSGSEFSQSYDISSSEGDHESDNETDTIISTETENPN